MKREELGNRLLKAKSKGKISGYSFQAHSSKVFVIIKGKGIREIQVKD